MRQVLGEVANLPASLTSVKVPAALKPAKSGSVHLCQHKPGGGTAKVRVVLSVYESSFDKYAVVSSDRILCKDCGYINLKSSSIKKVDSTTLQIIPKNCDAGSVLTFSVAQPQEADAWLATIENNDGNKSPFFPKRNMHSCSPSKRPRSPLSTSLKDNFMPALEEDEESTESGE